MKIYDFNDAETKLDELLEQIDHTEEPIALKKDGVNRYALVSYAYLEEHFGRCIQAEDSEK